MDMPFTIPVPVYKVGEKMFALINIHEPSRQSINLKYHKDTIGELRQEYELIKPGYHMNKANWNTVYLDGNLDAALVKELIDISYTIVFASLPKTKQKKIFEANGASP